jgi:sulfur relay (sulfurtransferase) DsrF/TusC family protein
MTKKILQIVDTAYRATLEEQDDTVIWFTHAIKAGGADVALLLRGAAVNYCATGQDASGLTFGQKKQTQPPDVAADLTRLIAKGVAVHAVAGDLKAGGLSPSDLIAGVTLVKQSALPTLFEQYDLVWQW